MRKQNEKQALQRQQIFTPIHIVNAMIDLIPYDDDTTWLEPSAGKGVFIRELIRRGVSPQKITAIEIDPILCTELSTLGCTVINADFFNCVLDSHFDVVIGNPPYVIQDTRSPYYHKFVEGVIDNITPDYFSFIIPSRWMLGGKGLDKHRERMMNDRRMKKIFHFAGDKEVFNTVSIKGGVNYFLWEKDYDGECEFCHDNTSSNRFLNTHDIVLQDNNAFGILDKINKNTTSYVSSKCISACPFGVRTHFDAFVDSGIKCIAINQTVKYINTSDYSDKHNISNKWKVCTSQGGSVTPGADGQTKWLGTYFILEPNAICTETYIVVNTFDSSIEAQHFLTYMKTKFFRFMLSLRMFNPLVNKEKFAWVPDQLDYSAPWTDAELYKKYNISRQEVAYIESKIKTI